MSGYDRQIREQIKASIDRASPATVSAVAKIMGLTPPPPSPDPGPVWRNQE